jgi:hypothetical protein
MGRQLEDGEGRRRHLEAMEKAKYDGRKWSQDWNDRYARKISGEEVDLTFFEEEKRKRMMLKGKEVAKEEEEEDDEEARGIVVVRRKSLAGTKVEQERMESLSKKSGRNNVNL